MRPAARPGTPARGHARPTARPWRTVPVRLCTTCGVMAGGIYEDCGYSVHQTADGCESIDVRCEGGCIIADHTESFGASAKSLRRPVPVHDKSPGHRDRGSLYVLVEAAGIEPASESGSARTSTCIARCLDLASRVSNGRDTQDASRRENFASSPSGQGRKLARVSDAPSRHHGPNRVGRVKLN